MEWKVGNLEPKEYQIVSSNINGQDITKRSSFFNVIKIPAEVGKKDVDIFCKLETGN